MNKTNEVIIDEASLPEVEVPADAPIEAADTTLTNWEGIFNNLANPMCKTCYGRGFVGWVITPKGRMPKACSKKGCALHKFTIIQQQARRRQMAEEQKKREEKVEEEEQR